MADNKVDTTTQSNIHDVASEHITFNWKVNFDTQVLKGSATHTLKVKKEGAYEVMYVHL